MKTMCKKQQSCKQQKCCLCQHYDFTSDKPLIGLLGAHRGGGQFGSNLGYSNFCLYGSDQFMNQLNLSIRFRSYSIRMWALWCFLISLCNSLYDIPSYYGHFSKKYFLPAQIQKGSFTYFEFNYRLSMNFQNTTVYYADTSQHCIFQYSFITRRKKLIVGTCGKSGNLLGDVRNSLFNKPQSIFYYQYSEQQHKLAQNLKAVIVSDSTCSLNATNCRLSAPYPSLQMENIRLHPYLNLYPAVNSSLDEYLYIADTQNHCIKRVNINLGLIQNVAGQCGISGFVDGPLEFNKLNRPSNLGVDKQGIIFFYDKGNEYMRKINRDGFVETLYNGACRKYTITRKVQNYVFSTVLCYQNWIEGTTQNPIQHAFSEDILNICLQQSSKCS